MRRIRSLLLASAVALSGVGLIGASDARADLVLLNGTVEDSFTDLGAQGFGNAPRMLTLQNSGNVEGGAEAGQVVVNGTGGIESAEFAGRNDVVPPPNLPTDKNDAPTIATLGWTSGSNVALGFNAVETGDVTLTDLVLTVYNSTGGTVDSYALGPESVFFSELNLALQTGNGNSVFTFILDDAQRAQWDLAGYDSTFRIGLAASFTGADGGPESFLGILGPDAPPPVPLPGALLLFASGLVGMVVLNRRRRNQRTQVTA